MLDVKRVLKAAPTKMRSQEPLQQLWTPWGEQIAGEWLSSNDATRRSALQKTVNANWKTAARQS